MSLINKMLQDLDARGGQPGGDLQMHIKPVPEQERRRPWLPILAGTGVAVALAVGSVAVWRAAHRPAARAAAALPKAPAGGGIIVGKPGEPVTIYAPASASAAPHASAAPAATQSAPTPVPAKQATGPASTAAPAGQVAASSSAASSPAPAPAPVRAAAPRSEHAHAAASVPHGKHRVAASPVVAVPAATTAPATGGVTAASPGDALYRRATAALADGRTHEAIRDLEQALVADPRHEAARQTLIGLLVEANRKEEAIGHLQRGLTLDPRQPSMAMLLARLQMERGGDGLETLQRTAPYAAGDADYEAFLAGALQRVQRHRDAIAHYEAALRKQPSNGVWWMGMGMSLQAEKRVPEALTAYRNAQSTNNLSPELQAFVEQKLQQLGR